ncbi:MAG TPA: FAD-dependent oxidoreductase [Polyangiaceae bacterium]|nr:FAD-dependent oxidoreductase [Polyangiaceae bacterium]
MNTRKKKLSVIGNGMGTCRLLDELVRRDATNKYEITVFGEERGGAYNRIMLGRVLSGESPDSIVTKTPEWYDAHGIRLIHGTRVERLDTLRKVVETADGQKRRYDVAILATGSQPLVPPLEGMRGGDGELRDGVFVYRTIADCIRMREYARAGDGAVIVGGGLLGLEAAKVLSDMGLHVTVVQSSKILMNAQLDEMGGEMLGRQIERHGIFTRTGRTVESIYGDERVTGVVLDDGMTLSTDVVVLACGVRPRIDLARASELPVNKGILVNDTLATEVPGVYAFGECAEHRGRTYGIVTPVWEQAAVLADVLTGAQPQERYRGSKLYTRLKVAGVDVASMGTLEPELERDQVLQIVEERRDSYRKLIIRDGRLVGAMLVGNTAATATLVQMFDRGEPIPDDPLELLCQLRASVPTGERVVCNCNKVTEQALCEAIAAGADSTEALGDATRAGTGCGSCRGDLEQLLQKHAKNPNALPLLATG